MEPRRIFSLLALTEGKGRWGHQPVCTWSVCLLCLLSQVPFKGARSGLHPHTGDGRSPQKGASGLLSSPLLAIFKDVSLLKRHLMTLSNSRLATSDLKTIVFNQSSRPQGSRGVGQLVLACIRLRNKQKGESITPRTSDGHLLFRTACFAYLPMLMYGTVGPSSRPIVQLCLQFFTF